jgi:hypothetical protein
MAVLMLWAFLATGQESNTPAKPEALLAAFVYNFCLFTDWPEESLPPDQPFLIATVGTPLPAFAALTTRKVGERPIRIVHLAASEIPPSPCHVLVVHNLPAGQREPLLAQIAHRPILTLSPDEGFCQAGGIVEFFLSGQRMRFRVSLSHMNRARLRIESRLLRLAETSPADGKED